ncbi:MAG: PDZ domain-containing protein, partial [Elusimicrobiales bacterium]|nr:PDZ domain-containing protein [Elusimicrobiales bacterium]
GIDRIIAMRLGLDRAAGVIVNQTVEGSPADKAGIRRGDIIIKCNGEELAGSDALVLQTFSRRPGDVISLEIIRNGRTQTVKVALGDRDRAESGTQTAVKADKGNAEAFSWEGIELSATRNGAKITAVRRGSKLIGHLQKGDIVNSVNNIAINSNATMKKAFAAADIQEGVLFDITRDGHPTYVSVQIAR